MFCPTKNDGTMSFSTSRTLVDGCVCSSVAPMMSTGEAELVSVRSVRRVPRTTISCAPASLAVVGVAWANTGAGRIRVEASSPPINTFFAFVDAMMSAPVAERSRPAVRARLPWRPLRWTIPVRAAQQLP